MTKRERIEAALTGRELDRVPFGMWMHTTVHEKTPEAFAGFMVDLYEKYDPDFVKVMYDWNYDTPVNFQFITTPEVWNLLEEFDPHIGAFGRQLQALKVIREKVGPDVPIIQTVLSPFHWANRLAYRRVLEDWKTHPDAVQHGLETIGKNYVAFAKACMQETDIDGFFFGAWGCEPDWMGPGQYEEMVMPSDKLVLEELRKASILILHIHGEEESYFDLLKDYPCDAISWEDRLAGPSIKEAKTKTDKCLIGGINHIAAVEASKESVLEEAQEAIQASEGTKFILGPGCTFLNETPPENIMALKNAVKK